MGKKKRKVYAIPPNDYEGTIADWTIELITRGHMKDGDFYGDVKITEEEYGEILEQCEDR